MRRIRHIATSWNGIRVVVGAFEHRVAVWDVLAGQKISEFDTVLDFGGNRLAITRSGERVVAGAYNRYGIACYDAANGSPIWNRKDLKKVQDVSVSEDHIYCGFDERACHVLDVVTGDTIETMRGVSQARPSPWGGSVFLERKSGPAELRTSEHELVGRIEKTTFAFLSAAFSPDYLITSESGGPIRCFTLADAQEVWRLPETPGIHALKVAFDEDAGLCEAILWPYAKGGVHRLVRLDPQSGQAEESMDLPDSSEYGFCARGTQLLTWDGTLISTADGSVVNKLAFPDTSVI